MQVLLHSGLHFSSFIPFFKRLVNVQDKGSSRYLYHQKHPWGKSLAHRVAGKVMIFVDYKQRFIRVCEIFKGVWEEQSRIPGYTHADFGIRISLSFQIPMVSYRYPPLPHLKLITGKNLLFISYIAKLGRREDIGRTTT